jgi:hypothetical protein
VDRPRRRFRRYVDLWVRKGLGRGTGATGAPPLRPCRHQCSLVVADQSSVGTGSSKGEADEGSHLDNPR